MHSKPRSQISLLWYTSEQDQTRHHSSDDLLPIVSAILHPPLERRPCLFKAPTTPPPVTKRFFMSKHRDQHSPTTNNTITQTRSHIPLRQQFRRSKSSRLCLRPNVSSMAPPRLLRLRTQCRIHGTRTLALLHQQLDTMGSSRCSRVTTRSSTQCGGNWR